MITITLNDETYQGLSEQANAAGIEVDLFLAQIAKKTSDTQVPKTPSIEDRRQALKEWRKLIEEQSQAFPPGFQVDIDRELVYREREDTQI